jgi:hypothetical protein
VVEQRRADRLVSGDPEPDPLVRRATDLFDWQDDA